MGFWGATLYSNDATSDVRDTYKGYLEDQFSNEDAYQKTFYEYQDDMGTECEPFFWFAMADTQWKVGRLRPEVKEKALEWIEKDGCLDFFKENHKGAETWKNTLQKLKDKLEQPMPKEKKFPKLDQNPWNLHDVYAYQFHTERSEKYGCFGKYILFQKIGEGLHFEKEKLYMHFHVINHLFDDLPVLEDVNRYRVLPLDKLVSIEKRLDKSLKTRAYLPIFKPSDFPKKYFTFLGNKPGPENNGYLEGLGSLEDHLGSLFKFWQDRNYEAVESGIYLYKPE